ncbi:MAG: MgtC/SapB family protein, partial [Comamonadaceae bacterium]
MDTLEPTSALLGLAVALGVGLIVGIERERRKGDGDRRAAAGLRTFAIAALAVVSHGKSRSRDPGMTTEIALFATYLLGVLCIIQPSLG